MKRRSKDDIAAAERLYAAWHGVRSADSANEADIERALRALDAAVVRRRDRDRLVALVCEYVQSQDAPPVGSAVMVGLWREIETSAHRVLGRIGVRRKAR